MRLKEGEIKKPADPMVLSTDSAGSKRDENLLLL
jgi:hypothetical protein